MDKRFWLERWNKREIGFHEPAANSLLVDHFEELAVSPGGRVFLPLCGKTLDIAWLLAQDLRVVGAELARIAVDELFSELGLSPEIRQAGKLTHYSAARLDVFVGDIFELSCETLGEVDAVYDRAAFVALPEPMRAAYARHMTHLSRHAPQLLVTLEYDQAVMDGPPFSIADTEVVARYGSAYEIEQLRKRAVEGGLKGRCEADEAVWLLRPGD